MTIATKTAALLALTVLAAGCDSTQLQVTAAEDALARGIRDVAPADQYHIDVPGRTLRVSSRDWTPMKNEYDWAENFEATRTVPGRAYQIVTVFKLPMTDDRRSGVRISPNEYLEVFATNPGEVTVLVRVDRQAYWVLSREMFAYRSMTGLGTKEELHAARIALQPQIDTTRYLLQTFGASE